MSKELMQQALDAIIEDSFGGLDRIELIEKLTKAIAQPVQPAIAYMTLDERMLIFADSLHEVGHSLKGMTPLYKSPETISAAVQPKAAS